MTTINNDQSLIEKVGGIDRAREIVDGAPESNFPVKWGLGFKTYFRQVGYFVEQWFEGKWQTRYSDNWVDLESLRTAIAKHDSREFKVGDWVLTIDPWFGKTLLKITGFAMVAEKTALFECGGFFRVSALRHATPLEIKDGHRIDERTDHVTDIRNHVSPSTKVVDL